MKQKCTCHVGIFHGEDLSSIRCNGNCQKQNFWKDLSDVPSFFIFLISALTSTIVKKLFKRKKDLSNTCFDGNCAMSKSTAPNKHLEQMLGGSLRVDAKVLSLQLYENFFPEEIDKFFKYTEILNGNWVLLKNSPIDPNLQKAIICEIERIQMGLPMNNNKRKEENGRWIGTRWSDNHI